MNLESNGKTHKKSFELLKTILVYFKRYKFRISLAIVSMGGVAASTTAMAWLVQPALDEIFINKDRDALLYIPFLVILVVALGGVFTFTQKYSMSYCGVKVLERLQNELYAKIIRLPLTFYNETQIGMLMARILNDVQLISRSLPAIIRLTSDSMTVVGLVGLVIYRDPFLAFFSLLVFPLSIYPIIYLGKKLRQVGRRSQKQIAHISSLIQETFNGIQVVKAFATERQEEENFIRKNSKFVRIILKGRLYSQLSSPLMDVIGALGAGLVIWYGGLQVISEKMTAGEFFSFLTAMFLLYKPLKSISSSNLDIQNALAGAERVFEILQSPEITVEDEGNRTLSAPLRGVDFHRVTFQYPGSSNPVLFDIDLHLKSGEKIALVGPSGSGKTTLTNLIPRFYDVTSGEIRINDLPISQYTLTSLRQFVGIVSQDPFLFNTTIRENISYGLEDVSQQDIEQAARAAYAENFIHELPEGYETVIGERGIKLSGGQKQRITIARALLKNPPLLVLDEATSALDTESERIVQQALENLMKERTSIIIAHRLSTVLSADRIVVMSQGRIVDTGTHEELLKTNELYIRLYEMQFQTKSNSPSTSE